MDTSEKTRYDSGIDQGDKRPKVWGVFFMLAGITGLTTSIYSGYYDMYNIVPLFGTVIAGVLIAALSILMIVYGYRLFKRDI
jgi:hypothetical protein